MTPPSSIRINGVAQPIPARWMARRLLDFLRMELALMGVKEGCGEGDCGACTVLVDGEPMCSCLLLCGVVAGRELTTVEGIARTHRERFAALCAWRGGVQCGFCTSGIVVMSAWLAAGGTETGAEPLAKLLEGNLCRCTGYQQLLDVIERLQ